MVNQRRHKHTSTPTSEAHNPTTPPPHTPSPPPPPTTVAESMYTNYCLLLIEPLHPPLSISRLSLSRPPGEGGEISTGQHGKYLPSICLYSLCWHGHLCLLHPRLLLLLLLNAFPVPSLSFFCFFLTTSLLLQTENESGEPGSTNKTLRVNIQRAAC